MKWICKIQDGKLVQRPSNSLKIEQYGALHPEAEYDVIPRETKSHRTSQQNNALHLWCSMVADELNTAGLTVTKTLNQKAEIDWSTSTVKELLWKRMQKLVLHKESTTQLSKNEEIDKVYDHLVRYFSTNHKFELPPFPSAEQLEQIDDTFIRNK